jgi:hypothetical protein
MVSPSGVSLTSDPVISANQCSSSSIVIHDRGLTDAEIKQLRALLDEWEEGKS